MKKSVYNNKENLKITYFFGAGASYNSVPIWDEQGRSMAMVANNIMSIFHRRESGLYKDKRITAIVDKLNFYSKKALEFGTLDIYARSLYLLNKLTELNDLKYYLSIYFDLWEIFVGVIAYLDEEKGIYYHSIDKRYFSLLAVLLNEGVNNPSLNKKVSFLSWNYDLQLEMSYRSFMNDPKRQTLKSVNYDFNFFEEEANKKIIHLNGFRGVFNYEGKIYPNVEKEKQTSLEEYLLNLLENKNQFRKNKIDYNSCIKYSWEMNSNSLIEAKLLMEKTNVLIIIGYSFPTYNRKADSELIKSFEKGDKTKKVIYQDPNPNKDLISTIFSDSIKVEYVKNLSQFYVPQEFLFPEKNEEIIFG